MREMSLHPRHSHLSGGGHVHSGSAIGCELGSWNIPPHMQPNMTVTNTAYPSDVADHGGFDATYSGVASSSAEVSLDDHGQSVPTIGYNAQQAVYSTSPPDASEEVQRLQRRIHELECELNRSRSTIENLCNTIVSSGLTIASPFCHAHRKQICSLNHICAWHGSHREHRAYPPRNAPPGHLNSNCTACTCE